MRTEASSREPVGRTCQEARQFSGEGAGSSEIRIRVDHILLKQIALLIALLKLNVLTTSMMRRAEVLQRFQILDDRSFFFSAEAELEMLVVVVYHVVQCGKPAIVIKTTMHVSE
jgi:hypothetical protein